MLMAYQLQLLLKSRKAPINITHTVPEYCTTKEPPITCSQAEYISEFHFKRVSIEVHLKFPRTLLVSFKWQHQMYAYIQNFLILFLCAKHFYGYAQ